MFLGELGAGDHRSHLLLFDHLPLDELLDIGMIDVDDHHLRRAARGAARLDRARGAVADLQEAHQTGGLAAARKLLVLAAQVGEVRAGARAVFEEARFTRPQIHDAAFVHQIVGDGLDEAGVRLRMLISGERLGQTAGLIIDVVMTLARAIDAIGPMQAGVEPLRAVRRGLLGGQHEAHLVIEGAGIGFAVEIAALPAPIGPGAGEAIENLLGGVLADALIAVRLLAPQPFGHVLLGDGFQLRGDAGFAEILLGEHVARDLAPLLGDFNVALTEHNRAIGVLDLARNGAERDALVSGAAFGGELATNTHGISPAIWLLAPIPLIAFNIFETTMPSPGARLRVAAPDVRSWFVLDVVPRSATGTKYGQRWGRGARPKVVNRALTTKSCAVHKSYFAR